ncbi:6PF2K-domain-containing protein [Neoconidiobolus thromboides FSU 785]|nr:6PF2K-domain-containing protein [Neoconidiobolus thromboides FSU 785]
MMSAQLYKTESGRLFHAGAIAIITVGLPARGKTHISRSLRRYLHWVGVKVEVFHVGDYRRKLVGPEPNDFFDPANQKTVQIRTKIINAALNDMIQWFMKGGQVGIFDASNTTRSKRQSLYDTLTKYGIEVVFVESFCDKDEIIEANILGVKVSSPDYTNWDPQAAKIDFERRIANHLPYYEPLDEKDSDKSYIKIINLEQMVINNVKGYLETRIIYYLMNLHITHRSIYFARIGTCHKADSLTSAPCLDPEGLRYAKALKDVIIKRRDENRKMGQRNRDLKVWTSTGESAVETGFQFISAFEKTQSLISEVPHEATPPESILLQPRKALVQIDRGLCQDMSEDEIKAKYPEEFVKRKNDIYRHRYPRAEVSLF